MKFAVLTSMLILGVATSAPAAIIVSEVDAAGSATPTSSYHADWFELTNTGATAVTITDWTIDDNSNSFGSSVTLRGVTSIAPGQAVVFVEGLADGSTDATIDAAFEAAWFATVPTGFTIGNYGGAGVGLSQTSDAVNIFDSTGTVQANVSFGASILGATFDNNAGINGAISTFSAVGVNGAFNSQTGGEIGSPGGPVPEPASLAILGIAGIGLFFRRRAGRI